MPSKRHEISGWLVGQAVKTSPSHGENRGSIPLLAVSVRDNSPTLRIPDLSGIFLYDRKFHFLSYKKRRSAEDAHSREKQSVA